MLPLFRIQGLFTGLMCLRIQVDRFPSSPGYSTPRPADVPTWLFFVCNKGQSACAGSPDGPFHRRDTSPKLNTAGENPSAEKDEMSFSSIFTNVIKAND